MIIDKVSVDDKDFDYRNQWHYSKKYVVRVEYYTIQSDGQVFCLGFFENLQEDGER